MRILLVSSGSGSQGGGEIFLDYLGSGLAASGHEVLLWLPAHPRMDALADKCACFSRVIRADYRNTYDHAARSLSTSLNHSVSARVAREWSALRPAVIHLNKQNLEDGLDLLRAATGSGVASVCTIHLTQTARYLRARAPHLRDWIAGRALRRYSGVMVAVQEARRVALADFLGAAGRTRTIFNGVPLTDRARLAGDREAMRSRLALTEGDFLVIGLGRLVEQKRPFLFLDAAVALHRRMPSARFVWVGDGDLREEWEARVRRAGMAAVITCAGWQPDAVPFLAAADLLLHVAAYEALPLAILEAMAAGVPCAMTGNVAAEIPGCDDATVLLADDVEQLADRLGDRVALDRTAGRARALVERDYSQRTMVDAYERLYRDVAQP